MAKETVTLLELMAMLPVDKAADVIRRATVARRQAHLSGVRIDQRADGLQPQDHALPVPREI